MQAGGVVITGREVAHDVGDVREGEPHRTASHGVFLDLQRGEEAVGPVGSPRQVREATENRRRDREDAGGDDARRERAAMLHRFDEHRDHQQQTDRPARAGEEAGDGGHPPARTPRREQHDGCEQHERRLGISHDEHERGREQVHEPHRTARERIVVAFEPRQPVEHEAERERRRVRDDDRRETRVDARYERERASEQWEEREEAESVGADRVVATARDVDVERGIPRAQTLTHLDRVRDRRQVTDDFARESEGGDHQHA